MLGAWHSKGSFKGSFKRVPLKVPVRAPMKGSSKCSNEGLLDFLVARVYSLGFMLRKGSLILGFRV